MPQKPNTKVTKILMSELMFLCEWDKCDQVFRTMEDFLSHMTQHLMVLHNLCKLELEGMCITLTSIIKSFNRMYKVYFTLEGHIHVRPVCLVNNLYNIHSYDWVLIKVPRT
jgi:hypothetical protein